ncbi:MAG: leucyl/phenylalanyl-tRNA--protein transferase [Bernardetiaceae bacterium]
MPVYYIDQRLIFPPPDHADPSGLLGVGGDLSTARLMEAYRQGIFPWYAPEDPIQWWSPDPRFVLYSDRLRIPKSVRPLLRKQRFRVTVNADFAGVIRACKEIYRPQQEGTWISDELEASYLRWHQEGIAHSVEVWEGDQLVGGLYGELLGRVFFGESMFSRASNASRVGFIVWVRNLQAQGLSLIDCQIYTEYLASFGAELIPRDVFLAQLRREQQQPFSVEQLLANFRQDVDFLLD